MKHNKVRNFRRSESAFLMCDVVVTEAESERFHVAYVLKRKKDRRWREHMERRATYWRTDTRNLAKYFGQRFR